MITNLNKGVVTQNAMRFFVRKVTWATKQLVMT